MFSFITYYPKCQAGALTPFTRDLWTQPLGDGGGILQLGLSPILGATVGRSSCGEKSHHLIGHEVSGASAQACLLHGLPGKEERRERRNKCHTPPHCGRAGWGHEQRWKVLAMGEEEETPGRGSDTDSKSHITTEKAPDQPLSSWPSLLPRGPAAEQKLNHLNLGSPCSVTNYVAFMQGVA